MMMMMQFQSSNPMSRSDHCSRRTFSRTTFWNTSAWHRVCNGLCSTKKPMGHPGLLCMVGCDCHHQLQPAQTNTKFRFAACCTWQAGQYRNLCSESCTIQFWLYVIVCATAAKKPASWQLSGQFGTAHHFANAHPLVEHKTTKSSCSVLCILSSGGRLASTRILKIEILRRPLRIEILKFLKQCLLDNPHRDGNGVSQPHTLPITMPIPNPNSMMPWIQSNSK